MNQEPHRVILAITGASGAILGIRVLEILREKELEIHLVISQAAAKTIPAETGRSVAELKRLATFSYDPDEIGARLASGSFVTDGMLVVPCSIKTLSGIANSYTDNLIVRAADVCLKEGRRLILAVRETPLHAGHLRLMQLASQAGAIIFPPIPAFYSGPRSLDEIVTGLAGRLLLCMGIDNDHYGKWDGDNATC